MRSLRTRQPARRRRRGDGARKRTWIAAVCAAAVVASLDHPAAQEMPTFPKREKPPPPRTAFDPKLPSLGMIFKPLPPGPGKDSAQQACLRCHSADIIVQQRLNEKQWTAELEKMAKWGAVVPEAKKAGLVAYLLKNFGPGNDKFAPIVTRPAGY